MNNKVKRILSIGLIVVLVLSVMFALSTVVNADSQPFDPISGSGGSAVGKVQNWGSIILGVFQAVGMVIAVIMLVWLGIKYLMASPDGKAEIKKQAFAYVLGAVLLFGATGIIEIVKNVISEQTTETSSYVQTIDDIQKS